MNNLRVVLEFLASVTRNSSGDAWATGNVISNGTNLSPPDINDAISIAKSHEYVEVLKTLGTAPYDFQVVQITAQGRLWLNT